MEAETLFQLREEIFVATVSEMYLGGESHVVWSLRDRTIFLNSEGRSRRCNSFVKLGSGLSTSGNLNSDLDSEVSGSWRRAPLLV